MKYKKTSSLSLFVGFSIAACIIYTIITQVVAIKSGQTMDTLTTCFFALFGGEVVSCALIKIFKLRGGDDGEVSNGGDVGVDSDNSDNGSN